MHVATTPLKLSCCAVRGRLPHLTPAQRKRRAETKKAAEERELAARLAYEARAEAEEEEAQRLAAKAALKAFLLKCVAVGLLSQHAIAVTARWQLLCSNQCRGCGAVLSLHAHTAL